MPSCEKKEDLESAFIQFVSLLDSVIKISKASSDPHIINAAPILNGLDLSLFLLLLLTQLRARPVNIYWGSAGETPRRRVNLKQKQWQTDDSANPRREQLPNDSKRSHLFHTSRAPTDRTLRQLIHRNDTPRHLAESVLGIIPKSKRLFRPDSASFDFGMMPRTDSAKCFGVPFL